MDTKTAWQTLRDYAEGRIHHANAGSCPDSIEGPTARDSDCPLCQALDATQDCLAQIEEPAQPIAGYRISDPSDPTIKPWLSETPDDNGYTSEPLYAGAAPAAVAPRGDYPQLPEGVMCIEQVGGEVIGRPTDYGFKHGRGIVHGAELFTSEQLRAYFDLGRQSAQAAPALEAPAAPAWLDGWKLVPEVATREMCAAMLSFLKDGFSLTENGSRPMSALYADLLAAAPQAPAAPWKDHLTARLVNDLRDCAIKYHSAGQLRDRIAHIVAPLCDQLKAAQAEPAAPAVDADPLDVCTDPYNCARCKTHPAHRGDMHHAGISGKGGSA